MSQHLFGAEAAPSLVALDGNFTELYGRTAYQTTDATRTLIATVGGAGSPYMATGQTSDMPYYEWQRWNGSGSNYGGSRIMGVANGATACMRANDAAVGSQTWLESWRADASGNLLVGATSGTTQGVCLQPNGSSTNAANIVVGHITGTSTGAVYSQFAYNGTVIGSVTQNGTTGVSYNTSSDYRLKSNVQPMTGSGAFIDALKPCTWTWIRDSSSGAGFIAHELQAVSPGSVTGAKDAVQDVGDLKDAQGTTIAAGVQRPATLTTGQTWTKSGTAPIYQGVEYGSAEVIAMMAAELQAVRVRLHALDGRA